MQHKIYRSRLAERDHAVRRASSNADVASSSNRSSASSSVVAGSIPRSCLMPANARCKELSKVKCLLTPLSSAMAGAAITVWSVWDMTRTCALLKNRTARQSSLIKVFTSTASKAFGRSLSAAWQSSMTSRQTSNCTLKNASGAGIKTMILSSMN